ncbi:MAG: MBL fold metallo-hydrolase, partial [Dehalococcoidia bacterium]|nr:MBL fold metallo-hydrolase [Dehalococcoidia bacterium]
MINEVLPGLYRLEIPLPKSPLKALNSYVVKGDGRFLIIDTGMNREECIEAMRSGLSALGVDLNRTDFFITHFHADHLGLAATLAADKSRVYLSQVEAQSSSLNELKRAEYWKRWDEVYRSHGFAEDQMAAALQSHPGRRYSLKRRIDFSIIREGDRIDIGEYSFRCIETPGHSPGHVCLYDDNKKVLISGDHILDDITPNITAWPEMENSLRRYLESLDRVYDLDVKITLPGHRSLISDHRARIRELRAHHEARLQEAMSALENGPRTAYQVAPRITWDIGFKSWSLFPPI